MQSLKIQQQLRLNPTPIARISPRVLHRILPSHETFKTQEQEDSWLSCDELETIERRFTDLLQEPSSKKSLISIYEPQDSRAKSCDRLTIDDEVYKSSPNQHDSLSRKSFLDQNDTDNDQPLIYDNNLRSRPQTPRTVLSSDDILKVESSYRSIGTQVFACRCLCELYITTAERLSKLEDWILFQHGLPVWLVNSGMHSTRPSRLSLILAEQGSGFPIWQDIITEQSEIKQARVQHLTFRFSDRLTLAVLRFHDLAASKEFFSYYRTIRNDSRYAHLFVNHITSTGHQRSSSCGSILRNRRKNRKNISKSSISNPCQFQHINSLQVKDRLRLISLDQCLLPPQNSSK